MCKPVLVSIDKAGFSAIRSEIMSACSSMNMPPELRDDIDQMEAFYMTDLYVYAQHALEHCRAAMQNSNALYVALDRLAWDLRSKGDYESSKKILDILHR